MTIPIRLLLVIAITVALLGLAVWAVGVRRHSGPSVEAMLHEAPGLREGAAVLYRGLDVGRVERLRLGDSAVLLTLRLTRDDVPLRAADRVRVRTVGLLGDAALEIVPSPGPGAPWREGVVLAADTLSAVRRDSVIRAASEDLELLLDALRRRADTAASPASRVPSP